MSYQTRPGYLKIKEAAVRYQVSRAKLHRLIRGGRVHAERDPRDERATLLKIEDLDALFRFPIEEVEPMSYETDNIDETKATGRLTAELRARIDGLRTRIEREGEIGFDSAAIIREERDRRSRELYRTAFDSRERDDRKT